MLSPLKKSRSNDLPDKIKELIQSLSNEEDRKLFTNIYKKVTRKTHNHESPKKNGDGTITKCIELFKQGASPEVLTQLEESLRGQEEYHGYYIKNFLPALKTGVMELKVKFPVFNNEIEQSQGLKTQRGEILEIISGITKKSSNKDHFSSTIQNQNGRRNNQTDRRDNAMKPFNKQSFSGEVAITESSDSSALERDSLAKGVSGKGTPGTYNTIRSSGRYDASAPPTSEQSQLNAFFNQSCEDLKNKDPSTTADAAEVPSGASTSKLSNDNGSDSGVSSREPSEENLELSVNSRRSSVSSILSSAGENNDLQKGNENQKQPVQTAKKEPKMQENENSSGQADPNQVKNEVSPGVIQVADIGIQREKNTDPSGQAAQMTGSQAKDSMQPEEKRDRKNAITIVQKFPVNEKKGEDTPLEKQPNNRNLHVALVAGCALSTIGCIVAGAMTSGLVGAGLLAMAAVFAIAAVAELHSNFLSSKLTSINVSPLVDGKQR